MIYIDAAAEAEEIKPGFEKLALRMTEDFSTSIGGRKLLGSADIFSPPGSGQDDYEAVGLLGFDGNMALFDPVVLLAPKDVLEQIAALLYQAHPTKH